jgi:hypothetical protein
LHTFIEEVEKLATRGGVDYIDAVLLWCEKNKLEVEVAAAWIKKSPVLKSKIQFEAERVNALKRGRAGATLPI